MYKPVLLIVAFFTIQSNAFAQGTASLDATPMVLKTETMAVPDEDPDLVIDKSLPDGIMLYRTKMVIVKNGVITPIEKDVFLANGTKIRKDGFIFRKNKPKVLLNLDEYIDASGNILPIKKTTSFTNQY